MKRVWVLETDPWISPRAMCFQENNKQKITGGFVRSCTIWSLILGSKKTEGFVFSPPSLLKMVSICEGSWQSLVLAKENRALGGN